MDWKKENNDDETQILDDADIDNEDIDPRFSVTSVFYVHLPPNVDISFHQPVIIGNCATLGNWKVPKVLLHKKARNSTLWVSEPVRIPTDVDVFYKYAMFRRETKWLGLGKEKMVVDFFEGYGEQTNRKMEFLENHYDLWQDNYKMKLNKGNLKTDFQFVNCIYENIKNAQTLKDRIMEYQYIFHQHKEFTNSATNINFIKNKLVSSVLKEQRLFLCLLLGYYMLQPNKVIFNNCYLPREFPSIQLLEDLENVDADFSLSDTKHQVSNAIRALVQHNSKYGSIMWFKMFALAPTLDESYAFIDTIEFYNFENQSVQFLNALENNVKPHIDDLFYMKNVFYKAVQKLISLSYNLECLLFLCQKIIGFEKTDDHLRKAMKKRIDELIKYEHPPQLKEHFYIFPDELRRDVAQNFRTKLLKLLKARNFRWENPDIVSLQELLQEIDLQWPVEEYLQVLESIAGFDQMIVLESFPEIMKLVLESKVMGKTHDQILESSVKWFEKMISFRTSRAMATNGPKNRENIAYIVFYYLSQAYPLVSHRQRFSGKLKEQADKILHSLSDDVIFPLASCIDEFHEDVIDHFDALLRQKIEHSVQDPDDKLLKTIMQICSSKEFLNVNNGFCEKILCFILDRLQPNDRKLHNKDAYQLSLFRFSRFWTEIFLARGHTNELHSHPYVKNVRDHIVNVTASIAESTITMGFLLELLKFSGDKNEDLIKYFNSAIESQPGKGNIDHLKITDEILVVIRQQCQKYMSTFTRLDKFYERFCSSALITDARKYHEDLLRRRDDIKTVTLGESDTRDYWSIHSATIDIMDTFDRLVESQTFNNIFQTMLKAEIRELNVEIVITEIIQMAIKRYNTISEGYEKWENIKCSEADELWKHVDPNNIRSEIDFMTPNWTHVLPNKQLQLLISSITHLTNISPLKEKLNNLLVVIENLKIPHNPNHWVITFSKSLSDENSTLGNLQKIFEHINKQFKQLKLLEEFWSIIKEMACSKECINFLQELVGHDLKNLINGADDHSDERLIQEDTVSTFIQVKQILEPLLSKNEDTAQLAVDKFVKSLVDIIKTNTSLDSKLRLCNAHTQALKNMYKNISKRGEVTKEKIFYAVTKGAYSFMRIENDEYRCTATLSYQSNNIRDGDAKLTKYAFSDLQDLRGRALLIAKAPVDTNMLDENNMVNEIKSSHMNEFVIQVDISQQIIDVSSQLVELGHFGYRDFKASTRSTREMEDLLQMLTDHLNEWQEIVNKAQEEYYYLTFFLARHILTFYDYFTFQENHDNNKNTCAMLLRLVNDEAKLPVIKEEDYTIFGEYNNYSDILCTIGTKLRDIFIEIPRNRPITANVEQIALDIVHSGQLFVATCINKLRVPNIIMSLYVNFDKCYPESWQLLICKSSTRAEELFIFTKRCFFAAKNGYKKYLFCIANVEYLEFDLQYRLVTHIRSLCQQENQFNLALICCREKGMHHHILDQFSEHVHVTEGLDAESMRNIYKELCPNVVAVSSDLSGQGKTEWIKERSFENDLIPRSFLVSDGMTFGELVRRLSETEFREFESLHLNIMLIDYPYDVNMFLFELLSLRIARNGINLACIPSTLVFIEVASTMEQYLLNSLPITGYLTRQHLTWNIDNLFISHNHNSSIQIVARYLDAHDQNVINGIDINFTEEDEPIPQERCQQLFQNYFFRNRTQDVASYRFLEIFINVLADQLLRMSSSAFFRVELLTHMVNDKNIRKTLLETLMDVSSDFATRSVNSKADQLKNLSDAVDAANANLGTIKHWEDSNHLLVFFLSQTPDSICALYRDKTKVPQNVKNLLSSQHVGTPGVTSKFKLDNYDNMSPDKILEKLECLARNTLEERKYPPYALSTNNLLKMALILLRARANVPVVCCGEAGCGKTSLIQFLSIVVNVEFEALNLHAGIREQDILDFMAKAEEIAQERQIWLFFDEINTCNHIGLLANLIAHRELFGRKIHHNIRLFSACNPYRLRLKSDTQAGLLAKRYEEHSNLVYQVHPLPDQILDFVWDYGVLKPSDEKIYIGIMVRKNLEKERLSSKLFSELLFASQEFIRSHEGAHSVSLRDVKRAITLVKYFHKSLIDRPRSNRSSSQYPSPLGMEKEVGILVRSYILALCLSYQVRIFDQTLRKQFREIICRVFNEFKTAKIAQTMTEDLFIKIIKEEQKDYIVRMTKPPQTAENDALLENVLVMIVCIFTKIPVFIIGAPGASKSLAIRLISQNLRGADSDDPYFKKLPQIYIIPYQGSTSSTSDGIIKVFQKAQNYQTTSSKEYPLNTVVLLDEVGLAETSPHNPLKVLHSLLEPSYPAEYPNVSVVGISNWRLDNSKSSRALLVQRPKFEEQDLIDTADRLFENNKIWSKRFNMLNALNAKKPKLGALANSYLEYEKKQPIDNFHGLRDYYSLVKSLGGSELTPNSIKMALARNFGGTNQMDRLYDEHFVDVLKAFDAIEHNHIQFSAEDLIKANLKDKNARHLMLIGKSDSIVNILTYKLRYWNKELSEKKDDDVVDEKTSWDLEPVVIYGSQFPDDCDGDYQYGVLSRIMMCVEAGRPLILTDLEIIYGSLYDLWNQNYITVGKEGDIKYYTRVALGAYSNPMVCVHENFRCILVLDEKNVNLADPPLLNRFEKQKMSINDALDDYMERLVAKLADWSQQISNYIKKGDTSKSKFNEHDIFIGFDKEETLQSLVIHNCNNQEFNNDDETILNKCKELLIGIATSDGIVRSKDSMLSLTNPEEVQNWYNFYFNEQQHENLFKYIQSLLNNNEEIMNKQGFKVIINTFSNINTDVSFCLDNILKYQVDKISTFKSEAQLQNRIKHFWLESDEEILILQCDLSIVNSGCVKLAKFIIEQYRNEYLSADKFAENPRPLKHVCIILHVQRKNDTKSSFNFMCGWDLVTIETLEPQEHHLLDYLDRSMAQILDNTYTFEEIIEQELFWCLLCMRFRSPKSVDYIKFLFQKIPRHDTLIECLKIRSLEWLQENVPENWQLQVATNKTDLHLYSSFSVALQTYIRNLVRKPTAKLLCALERSSGLSTLFKKHDDPYEDELTVDLLEFWKKLFMDPKIVNIEFMEDPRPDRYFIQNKKHDLVFPFSIYIMGQIDKFRRLYEEDLATLEEKEENLDDAGELKTTIIDDCIERFSANIMSAVPILKLPHLIESAKLYFKDFLSVFSQSYNDNEFLSWIISHNMGQQIPNPFRLHVYWWSNSEIALTELQLSKLCPTVIEEMLKLEFEQSKELDFEQYLLEQISKMMMEKLCTIDLNDINRIRNQLLTWQCDTTYILSLSSKLPKSYDNPAIHKLRIYNDLSKSLELQKLIEIRNIEKDNDDEVLSGQFVDIVFEKLYELQQTEDNLSLQRSFTNRCLNTLPLQSPIRLHLYEKIFTQEPLPSLSFTIIHRIFLTEYNEHDEVFFNLINDPLEVLEESERLQVIENILSKKHPDSEISALCCDVIQTQFFSSQDFQDLSQYFMKATEVLVTADVKLLQRISAIALLKSFVNNLWNFTSIQKSLTDPIEFEFGNEEEFSINDLNQRLELQKPLIHSLMYYLLKSLRLKEFSIDDIKRFCEVQQQIMPWLGRLLWDDNDCRLGYNPYWYVKQYKQAEFAAARMLSRGDFKYLDKLWEDILDPTAENSTNLRISFAGIIIMRLYIIRATREWIQSETLLAQKIETYINTPQIPQFFKNPLLGFLSNKHTLCKLVADDDNKQVYIYSVIAHIVALHISIPQDSSPLATYMQALQTCQDDFILTCPSDELTVIINALVGSNLNDKRLTRYKCKCGDMYFVGECGNVTNHPGKCLKCGEEIGGRAYDQAAEGNTRLDGEPLTQQEDAKDQQGYIVEEKKTDNFYSIRSMTPASYRIIHLFVHAIIGIQAPSDVVSKFIKHNIKGNNTNLNGAEDMAPFCAMHINNDWDALKNILACGDEQLALVLHAILSEMTQQPLQQPARLTTSIERETWEVQFSQKYILPLTKNVMGTATDFSMLLETNITNAQQKAKAEVNEIMKLNDQYRENYLPRLWRLVGDANINNFQAYYLNNAEHIKAYPFLAIFLKHENNLRLINNLLPIVKFVQILSTSLSYRIERQEARKMTFRQFILNESDSDGTGETRRTLDKVFVNFADSWNQMIPYINRFQCHTLPQMPKMHDNIPIVFGLLEPVNESMFLCAIIDFLVQLQNTFLNEVIEIPSKTCQSLKFLEKIDIQNNDEKHNQYYLKSINLDNAREEYIVTYDRNSEIFRFSQFDLRIGHGREIQFDLRKIEAELALELVHEKSLIKPDEQGLYLEPFVYHKEMFSGSMTILSEIKDLMPQEHIPEDKKAIFTGTYSNYENYGEGRPSLALENPKELLSALEIILCFLKRTSGSDRDTLITEYIESWMKLAVLKENNNSYKLLLKAGLQLKHIVALYELVEEHVADVVATCIPQKYQEKLGYSMQREILDAIDLESLEQGEQAKSSKNSRIPAKAFATALKRFIIRYLSTSENIIETENLMYYLVEDESLECWPDWVDKAIIKNKFPSSLRISHTFETYQYIKETIEKSEMEKREHIEENKPNYKKPPPRKQKGKVPKYNRG
ncbi:e3 ubiquitin-protein ligase [Gigaspora margarita]|uniref:E3 ubiquitin-protein ligase n=2 Tax=Gigaspora margarita TaxID=4874 RepID=A0A8H4EHQ0_GIGMA|nr:e3 ubiquitin-protein ligase [Gigaspora margarita]